MSSNKSGRVLVAAVLAAALCLAMPAGAMEGREAALGALERLAAWFVETWMSAGLADGTDAATREAGSGDDASRDAEPPTPVEEDDDPDGCRVESVQYSGCIDPNG